ncbi:hypothetical protein TNCV_5033001 [Trichonephila clavipes]|nr:hypothetical protein TNCV_5033001 [Trichonephila clavipes]
MVATNSELSGKEELIIQEVLDLLQNLPSESSDAQTDDSSDEEVSANNQLEFSLDSSENNQENEKDPSYKVSTFNLEFSLAPKSLPIEKTLSTAALVPGLHNRSLGKAADLSEFDREHIEKSRTVDTSISGAAQILDCSRSPAVSIYVKRINNGGTSSRCQDVGWSRFIKEKGYR